MSGESRTILTRWAPPPDLTVPYGEHNDHVADVRLPQRGASGSPLVLLFHGGFWRQQYDRAHVGPLATALAAEGYVVATPEYRRTGAPGGGWPGTLDDVLAAARIVPGVVARLADVDDVPTVLAGFSAGGHLALWAAATLAREGRPPRRVVALASVADLRTAYDLDLDAGAVADLLGGGPEAVPDRYAAADPMSLLPIGTPLALVHGDRDAQVPVELSRRFTAAARSAGDDVALAELAGVDHFAVIDPHSPAWPAVLAAFSALTCGEPPVDGEKVSR